MGVKTVKFLKWAGGKEMLLPQLEPFFPKDIDRYIEPFLGSGALFWHIATTRKPKTVILADTNEELINVYIQVRDSVEKLIRSLEKRKLAHFANENYYYEVRAELPSKLNPIERASRFIYLNRTCFNGLYRVNSKGEFNVPKGSYKNPNIVQTDNLREASKLLQGVSILCTPFQVTLRKAKPGDVVYLDPPYHPLKPTSFTSYSVNIFGEKEQQDLKEEFDRLVNLGCTIIESNSDMPFIRNLYTNYKLSTILAKRLINSKSAARGNINEAIIHNK